MRVLHVIITLNPAAGGPPIVVTRLAAATAKLGHDVTIFAYESPGAEQAVEKALAGVPGFDAVHVTGVPPGGRLERTVAHRAGQALGPLVAAHDIVHAHGVWDPILRAGCNAARAAMKPYAVTPHGMLDPWSLAQSRTKKRIALALVYRGMLNRAAFLHWLNRDERELAAPLGITAPGVVIGNGIFAEELQSSGPAGAFRARLGAKLGDAPYALFMARLHYKKGLDYLADAMNVLKRSAPGLHLVVAGPDDGARGDFEKRIEAHGVSDRVHLVGPLYGPDKRAALLEASMFVLPSRQEGFSIGITEALASGLPVVVSDACHFPEVEEVRAGYVVALGAGPLAEKMAVLAGDVAGAKAMGEAGRRLVYDRFTWPQIARQMVKAYESTLQTPSRLSSPPSSKAPDP